MPAAKAPFVSSATQPSDKAGTTYRRIVVKVGTTLLTDGADRLNLEAMDTLVEQMSRLRAESREAVLVSSGAVAAGHGVLGIPRAGRDVPVKQVLAAAGQGRLMHAYEQLFGRHEIPVAQALLTRRDLSDRLGYLNVRNTLLSLLELKVVPIVNENDVVAVDELGGEIFGDNDMLSAMVANIVDADLLIMLGRVNGLFTADPNLDPTAQPIPVVTSFTEEIEALGGPSADGRGRGGMTTKLEAAKLATASGVDSVVASGRQRGVIRRLVSGESHGTFFPTSATRMESRKRYLLSQMHESDAVVVDSGAARALLHRNSSLLAAGVVDSLGDFDRGDVVLVLDTERHQLACGISNYSSRDIKHIRRLRSDRIELTLGHYFGDEVLHRDNIVILNQTAHAEAAGSGEPEPANWS
jgi:glutamate 5-kinase